MNFTNVVWTKFTEIKCFPTKATVLPPQNKNMNSVTLLPYFHEKNINQDHKIQWMSDELWSSFFRGMDMTWDFLSHPNPPFPNRSAEMLASDLQLDFSISSLPRRNRWRFGLGDGEGQGWDGSDSPHFFFCVSSWNVFVFFLHAQDLSKTTMWCRYEEIRRVQIFCFLNFLQSIWRRVGLKYSFTRGSLWVSWVFFGSHKLWDVAPIALVTLDCSPQTFSTRCEEN